METVKPFSARLHLTVFFYSASIILLLTLFLSLFAVWPMYGRLMATEERRLTQMAEAQAMAVGEWVFRAKCMALQVANRTQMREKLIGYNQGKIGLTELVGYLKPRLMEALLLTEELVGVSRFDKNKNLLAQSGVPLMSDAPPEFPDKGKDFRLGAPQEIGGSPYGVLEVNINDDTGELAGVDILLIDSARLERIVKGRAGTGPEVLTLIGYRRGDGFRSFFHFPAEEGAQEPGFDIPDQLQPFFQRALEGESGLARVGQRIVAFAPVEGSPWGCLVSTAQKDFRSPVVSTLLRTLSLVLFLLVAGLSGLWFIIKPLTTRIMGHVRSLEEESTSRRDEAKSAVQAREKAEKVLWDCQECNRAVLDAAPDPVIIYDSDDRVSYLNPAFSRVFGWEPGECLGKRLDYVPPGEKPEPREIAESLAPGQSRSGISAQRYDKRGRLIPVVLSQALFQDPGTGPGGSASILRLL